MTRALLFIIMLISIDIFALSCRNNKQEEDKEGYEFYYYPKKNVYYDGGKKIFFYSLDGAKTWDSIISASDKEPATLGEKIIIYSSDYNVYKDNPAHRKLYNGTLYNIITSDIPTAQTTPEVTERKAVKKNSTPEPEVKPKPEEDKPKKGLKKFLDKIFGKHHKKANPVDSLDQ